MENLTLVAHIPRQLLALIESAAAYEKGSGLRAADGVTGIPPLRITRLPFRVARGNGPRSGEIWLCDCAQNRQRRDRTVRIHGSTGFRRTR